MEREELEKLEQDRDNIRAWIQKYTHWSKSGRDRAKKEKYKRRLEFLQLLEQSENDKISRHHLVRRIKQWEKEPSSPAVEKLLQAGRECIPFLNAKILQNDFDFSQWILEYDGWEVLDEIAKKPPAASRKKKGGCKPAHPQVKQPTPDLAPAAPNRRERIDLKLEEIERETGRKMNRKEFALVAGYTVRNLQLFQQGKATDDVDRAFYRTLNYSAQTIVEILDKKPRH